MDGRVQIPVINYLRKRFNVDYVDCITEAGPNLILAEQKDEFLVQSILTRVKISIEKHFSVSVAIVGHYDCAWNPSSKEKQLMHLRDAVELLRQHFELPIIALWVDENWKVKELSNG